MFEVFWFSSWSLVWKSRHFWTIALDKKCQFLSYLAGHLCACWWLDWSGPCHHLRSLGCHNCVVASHCWAGYLSCCGSPRLNIPYYGPQHYWCRALQYCPRGTENPTGKVISFQNPVLLYLGNTWYRMSLHISSAFKIIGDFYRHWQHNMPETWIFSNTTKNRKFRTLVFAHLCFTMFVLQ